MQLYLIIYVLINKVVKEAQKSKKEKQKRSSEKKKLCKMCCLRDSINLFECLVFDKVIDKDTNYTEGLQNPSFEMYLCKCKLYFLLIVG